MTPKEAPPRLPRKQAMQFGLREKWWLWGGVGLLLTSLFVLPTLLSTLVAKVALPKIEQRLGLTVSVADIVVRFRHVRLSGVVVHKPQNPTNAPVRIPEMLVEYSPWSLFGGRIVVSRVVLNQPTVQLVRGGDEDNFSELLNQLRKERRTASGETQVRRLSGPETVLVQNGKLLLRDEMGVLRVQSFSADVKRQGPCQATLVGVQLEPATATGAKFQRLGLSWRSPSRFLPDHLPEISLEGGEFAPWPRLSLSGVSGTLKPDDKDARKAVIALSGGYGGVEQKLWQAHGSVRGGPELRLGDVQGELHLRAQRFHLSQLEPILKDSPVVDADQTGVDASLDLAFEKNVLTARGDFQMTRLSLFAPRLVAAPVRDLSFAAQARGQIDLKARKFKLDGLKVAWDGVEVQVDGEAEAQPKERRPSTLQNANGPTQNASWREKWRSVVLHVAVPPIACQSLLQALPAAVVPRIRDFQLDGTFSTDIRLFVDFAKLLKLPPASDEGFEDEVVQKPVPPKGRVGQTAANTGNAKDPKDDPVQISGQVGIDGCRVKKAPSDLDVNRLLHSFTYTVLIESQKELSFPIGPESPDFIPFEKISPALINSIMTTEDHGFLRHRGFIVPEFRSALQSNLERGYFRLGASSITMQMVKNVLLSREKTLSRKLQELFLTWYVENYLTDDPDHLKALSRGMTAQQFFAKLAKERPPTPKPADSADWPPSRWAAEQSFQAIRDATPVKKRILEIYFNAIEFGPYIYGIGRAARHYFGKEAADLTPREAAFFSSILPNPKRRYIQYCKGAADEGWEKYVDRIVRRVHSRGRMTDEQLQTALTDRLVFDRTEALSDRDCLGLVQYLSELPSPFAPPPPPPPPGTPPKVIPSLPPWVESHHGKLRYTTRKPEEPEQETPSTQTTTTKNVVPF